MRCVALQQEADILHVRFTRTWKKSRLAVKRPVILNGIEDVATRPDLAERVLQIELETIPDQNRISEKELWQKFDKQRPTIFSGLLDALVCALRELPTIKLDSLPRMADAALWATAGETAFGWKRGTFIAAYRQNLNEGAIASVDAHPIGVAIRQLLEKQNDGRANPRSYSKLSTGCSRMNNATLKHGRRMRVHLGIAYGDSRRRCGMPGSNTSGTRGRAGQFICAKPAKKRLKRLHRLQIAPKKTFKTFQTIFLPCCRQNHG